MQQLTTGDDELLLNGVAQEEVIDMVNAVCYGLAGSIWTTNLTQAHRCESLLSSIRFFVFPGVVVARVVLCCCRCRGIFALSCSLSSCGRG